MDLSVSSFESTILASCILMFFIRCTHAAMCYYPWRHVNKYLLQSDRQLIADPSSDTTNVQLSESELNRVT